MRRSVIGHYWVATSLGSLLLFFSIAMLLPALVSVWFGEYRTDVSILPSYLTTVAISVSLGLALLSVARQEKHDRTSDMGVRDALLTVFCLWVALSFISATAYKLILGISWTDALFESVSGLTTTGATVLTGLEHLPKSLLFFRQLTQWLGGMGLVVLAVAIIPYLEMGGGTLFNNEASLFTRQHKLSSRIQGTALSLWGLYSLLTLVCALSYWLAGMDFFTAVNHSLSTVSIGGFSTYDSNFAHFDSMAVKVVAIVFMCLSAANFGLHFFAVQRRSLRPYLQDGEFLALVVVLLAASGFIGYTLSMHHDIPLIDGIFSAISYSTTTGYTVISTGNILPITTLVLILLSCLGACGGSTGGGIKIIRFMLVLKQGFHEMFVLLHPRAHHNLKVGLITVENKTINSVWGFLSLYLITFLVIMVILVSLDLDFYTAISATLASINNLGPGQGMVESNYASIGDGAKWVLMAGMILGRLEFFTVIAIFTTAFWRK